MAVNGADSQDMGVLRGEEGVSSSEIRVDVVMLSGRRTALLCSNTMKRAKRYPLSRSREPRG